MRLHQHLFNARAAWPARFKPGDQRIDLLRRYSTQAEARTLGVLGYARNLDDGSVEVLAWGEAEQVDALIAWLKAGGPRSARVEKAISASTCSASPQASTSTLPSSRFRA